MGFTSVRRVLANEQEGSMFQPVLLILPSVCIGAYSDHTQGTTIDAADS